MLEDGNPMKEISISTSSITNEPNHSRSERMDPHVDSSSKGAELACKKARLDRNIVPPTIDTTLISIPSLHALTLEGRTNQKGKGKRKTKKPTQPPYNAKDFLKRFPTIVSYAMYLNGSRDSLHPMAYHEQAPLEGIRAHFVTDSKCLTKALAINMDIVARLGGKVQEKFTSSYSHLAMKDTTTHIIVASKDLRFKHILKLLHLKEEADLVGPAVAAGQHIGSREVWVVKMDWLQQCCTVANHKRTTKAKKIAELPWLVECEGDKKRRKSQLLRPNSTASAVFDPGLSEFNMPGESQMST